MIPLARHPAAGPAFVLAVCIAVMLGAYGFQYIGGLEPCHLCYLQRYAYYVAIPLAALSTALAATRGLAAARLPLVLTGLALLTGMAIAGYHAGVEYHWWPGPETCTAPDLSGKGGDMLAAIMNQGLVRCDEIPWSLFGISMAGYNFFISGALGLLTLRMAWKAK
ncbi:MAG: disulfide bond formation protein B [Alphaproteobacteria bacterium]|nr:disulfide bond formation protein B [Alphaproteobacteria bacterium]